MIKPNHKKYQTQTFLVLKKLIKYSLSIPDSSFGYESDNTYAEAVAGPQKVLTWTTFSTESVELHPVSSSEEFGVMSCGSSRGRLWETEKQKLLQVSTT